MNTDDNKLYKQFIRLIKWIYILWYSHVGSSMVSKIYIFIKDVLVNKTIFSRLWVTMINSTFIIVIKRISIYIVA